VADPIGGFDLPSQTKIGCPVTSTMPGPQVRDYGLAGANLGPRPARPPLCPFHTRNSSSLLPIHNIPISELAPQIPHFVVDLRTLSPDHRYKGSTKLSCRLIPFVFKIFPVNPLNSKI